MDRTDVVTLLARLATRAAFAVDVHGLERIPAGGPLIVAANHVGFADPVVLRAVLARDLAYAIDPAMARLSWVRPVAALARTFPVDPARPFPLRGLLQAIRDGGTGVIFPESRLTVTTALMDFYSGVGFLAVRSGAPVLPVHIGGMETSGLSRLRATQVRRSARPQVTVRIGGSLHALPGETHRAFTARLRGAIAMLDADDRAAMLRRHGVLGCATRRAGASAILAEGPDGARADAAAILRGDAPDLARALDLAAATEDARRAVARAMQSWPVDAEDRVANLLPLNTPEGGTAACAAIASGARLLQIGDRTPPRAALERIYIGNAAIVVGRAAQISALTTIAGAWSFHAVRAFVLADAPPAGPARATLSACLGRPVVPLAPGDQEAGSGAPK